MKKFFSLLLIFVLVFSLSACGKEEKKNTATVDLEYYASLGKLPECNYKLGDSIEKIDSELSSAYENANQNNEEYTYSVAEGDKTVRIDNGEFIYYYEKQHEENGVSFIVSLGDAYGFEYGASLLEIKNAVGDLEYTEESEDDSNSFFIFGSGDGSVLRFSFEKSTILFVFEENSLVATAVYSNENWNVE